MYTIVENKGKEKIACACVQWLHRPVYIIFFFLESGEAVWRNILYTIYLILCRCVDNRVLALE
jgi:hypothetical protein